ncbi:MAG: hypothetical protein M1834_004600 [Cirrosporium novae-zelandiae]|nr:MAG: hypothetical protein M1834_004600 [Cirrosporium novae-zelandiae]
MTDTAIEPKAPIVSHGRGGAANIGPDATPYVDASIRREGPEGDQGDGAYSAGRGGAGNIGSPRLKPQEITPHDKDVVPEVAMRPSMENENYHTGRGGEGNVHLADKRSTTPKHDGLADKLKHKLFFSLSGKKK